MLIEEFMSKTMIFRMFTRPMDRTIQASLLALMLQLSAVMAVTDMSDVAALHSLKDVWENTPPNWVGSDPCGDAWMGIRCNESRVTFIQLSSMGLNGQLSGVIQSLSELEVLDLSYNKGLTGPIPRTIDSLKKLSNLILVGCGFSGPIPDSIGSLPRLKFLSLNSNSFSGNIPPSIGNLSTLYWLDLADNKLTGTIPISRGNIPGLNNLLNTKHFHFGKNLLTGPIPPELFSSSMTLIHVLFETNLLIGRIPSTLGLVKTLEVVRLDRNYLSGSVPSNLNSLTRVTDLQLSNNKLTGSIPNLTGMNLLKYVDMSNNNFDISDVPPWFSTLESLITLAMEYTQLRGEVPQHLFSLPLLQTVNLRNNNLNGTLDIGIEYSKQLQVIDLQNNAITEFKQKGDDPNWLILVDNPVCEESTVRHKYCAPQFTLTTYETSRTNCVPILCLPDKIQSPNCKCSYPYMGTLFFRAPSFSNLGNSSYYVSLEDSLMLSFQAYKLPVDSVSLSNPTEDSDNYLALDLSIFPSSKESFDRSDVSMIGFILSNKTFIPPKFFGPYFFLGSDYGKFAETSVKPIGIIIGAAGAGGIFIEFDDGCTGL